MSEHCVITQLAEQYLNNEGQGDVADFLAENQVGLAKLPY